MYSRFGTVQPTQAVTEYCYLHYEKKKRKKKRKWRQTPNKVKLNKSDDTAVIDDSCFLISSLVPNTPITRALTCDKYPLKSIRRLLSIIFDDSGIKKLQNLSMFSGFNIVLDTVKHNIKTSHKLKKHDTFLRVRKSVNKSYHNE